MEHQRNLAHFGLIQPAHLFISTSIHGTEVHKRDTLFLFSFLFLCCGQILSSLNQPYSVSLCCMTYISHTYFDTACLLFVSLTHDKEGSIFRLILPLLYKFPLLSLQKRIFCFLNHLLVSVSRIQIQAVTLKILGTKEQVKRITTAPLITL